MSKAEERALEAYPSTPNWDERITVMYRGGFIKGYHQAEKDLELTWEDVEYIIETYHRVEYSREFIGESYNSVCREVLKRFKERKEE